MCSIFRKPYLRFLCMQGSLSTSMLMILDLYFCMQPSLFVNWSSSSPCASTCSSSRKRQKARPLGTWPYPRTAPTPPHTHCTVLLFTEIGVVHVPLANRPVWPNRLRHPHRFGLISQNFYHGRILPAPVERTRGLCVFRGSRILGGPFSERTWSAVMSE